MILAVREMPKPVVAAVNGPAVGIGCSLALACDLIVAGESSYFLLAFANIGLTARRRRLGLPRRPRRRTHGAPSWRCSASGCRLRSRSSGA